MALEPSTSPRGGSERGGCRVFLADRFSDWDRTFMSEVGLHAALAVGERDEVREARGVTVVERLAMRVVIFRTTGFLSAAQATFALDHLARVLDELGPDPRLHGLYDWGGMTGYAPEARAASTSFLVARRKGFTSVHILTGSSIVAMAVSIANMVVAGFIEATTDRPTFDARMKALLVKQ